MNNSYGKKSAGLHMKYIEREGAGKDGNEAELFDSKTSNKNITEWTEKNIEWAEHTEGEPHQFRVIISPEDAHELNLTEYTRELMERVQTDLGRDLVWTAANHYNTDNPHTHLVISGLDKNGEEVWIDREYISNGIRNRARELATQELGHRSEHEIDTTLNKEITQERFTSLDWKIDKVSHGNIVDMSVYPDDIDARKLHGKLIARLDHLVGYGLAIKDNSHEYILQDGWDTNLREMGERDDIIKTLHKEIKADPTK
jgi:type IV secretory pathway VirD2 relaxase